MKALVVFYSMYGHIYKMAQAVVAGAKEQADAEVVLRRVPETLSEDTLGKMGAREAVKTMSQVPACDVNELAEADAIIFGTPTRFGNMCGQMRQFLDPGQGSCGQRATGRKGGSVFTSSATQHGGQESTILSFHTTLLHHGMVIVGLPYHLPDRCGSTRSPGDLLTARRRLPGGKGERMPSENELAAARYQGKHVAQIAAKIAAK